MHWKNSGKPISYCKNTAEFRRGFTAPHNILQTNVSFIFFIPQKILDIKLSYLKMNKLFFSSKIRKTHVFCRNLNFIFDSKDIYS